MGAFSKILILLALTVAAAGAWFVYGSPPPEEAAARTVEVRVAAHPLIVGTFLEDGKAPLKAMPEAEAQPDFVTAAQPELIGAVIIAPVGAGVPVRRGDLLAPGQDGFLAAVLKPGMRAVSVAVDAVSGNAGHIFPGDRVDLLLTQQIERSTDAAADPSRAWASETILRNVRVIAVDQRLGGDLAHRNPSGTDEVTVARTITLEVMPEGAETIAVARNLGTLSLTLRSLLVEEQGGLPAAAPAEPGDARPTWAGDVSAVTRSASTRPVPETPAETSPPPPPPAVRVMRGGEAATVTQ